MLVTPFDFDVVTGPSMPRDDRPQAPQPAAPDDTQAGMPPARPQSE